MKLFVGYVDDPSAGPLGPGDKQIAVVTSYEAAVAVGRLIPLVEWWSYDPSKAYTDRDGCYHGAKAWPVIVK